MAASPMTSRIRQAVISAIKNRLPKRKTDQVWILLLLLSSLVFAYLVLISRLHNAEPDIRSTHLEDFRSPRNLPKKDNYGNVLEAQKVPSVSLVNNVDPFYNVTSDGTNLWDTDPKAPEWMKAYFNWHKHQRKIWSKDKWKSDRWMIMQCLGDQDNVRCGGTADRLKPLPFLLRIAYETKRILLIRWTRPAKLEEFLVPPEGGFDWRAPDWMASVMANASNGRRFVPSKIITNYSSSNLSLVRTRYQSFNGGSEIYDAKLDNGESPFKEIFYHIWRFFFRPSVGVAQVIEEQLDRMGLVPGSYVSAHVRALYAVQERPLEQIGRWTRNGLNCASNLRPGAPIFFASDSSDASEVARSYGKKRNATVVTHTPNPNPPLHLDRDVKWKRRKVTDFYDTFVDLYLIALAGCVTYNKGGYGHWGLLIGGDVQCFINQNTATTGNIRRTCEWQDGPKVAARKPQRTTPLFLEPMA